MFCNEAFPYSVRGRQKILCMREMFVDSAVEELVISVKKSEGTRRGCHDFSEIQRPAVRYEEDKK